MVALLVQWTVVRSVVSLVVLRDGRKAVLMAEMTAETSVCRWVDELVEGWADALDKTMAG